MRIHLVQYTASTANGETTGIARVRTDHTRPTPAECAEQIPGYVTGADLGPAPTYTLTYSTEAGPCEKQLDAAAIERVGRVVMRCANRGEAWDVEVRDASGGDVTFNFPCFA